VGSMTASAPTAPPAVQRSNASSALARMDFPPAYDPPLAFETLTFPNVPTAQPGARGKNKNIRERIPA
jgi:hypothetical protein